jgi:nucleoside-diphosphate-sugar epimerase
MKRPRIRTVLLVPLVLLALFYLAGVIIVASDDRTIDALTEPAESHPVIVLFGASGTAGDGILKAALADPDIRKIHVISRRTTPRIEEGIANGRVELILHMDYLDYGHVHRQISEADTVYWAIGISSVGVDEETYGRIHVDFPLQFVKEWTSVSDWPEQSFHFISSSDISEDSQTMWVQQKIRAEKALFEFAEGKNLRVIAYRPDYIGPTREEAHLGQKLLYGFFRPVGAAVQATEIGRAMIELTARGPDIANGTKVSTSAIIRYSDAYENRPRGSRPPGP